MIMNRTRPFGVTLLAILASLAAVIGIIHTLQYLHLFPFFLGPMRFFGFDLFGAILWGITALVYLWVARKLWNVEPEGWLFLVIISIFNLILAGFSILGASTFEAMLPALIVNGLILIYTLLPGTKSAFGTA